MPGAVHRLRRRVGAVAEEQDEGQLVREGVGEVEALEEERRRRGDHHADEDRTERHLHELHHADEEGRRVAEGAGAERLEDAHEDDRDGVVEDGLAGDEGVHERIDRVRPHDRERRHRVRRRDQRAKGVRVPRARESRARPARLSGRARSCRRSGRPGRQRRW